VLSCKLSNGQLSLSDIDFIGSGFNSSLGGAFRSDGFLCSFPLGLVLGGFAGSPHACGVLGRFGLLFTLESLGFSGGSGIS